uniref:Uncharacterized protein n=1 Tax=Sphaerodactylus townsendi TaxID=933632 RepID=A0ACB8G6L2_9SAUR
MRHVKRSPSLQKLEPLVLPKDVSLDTFSRQREGTAARTPKELEKRGPAVLYPPGRRRQHLHKMKMLEMRQEAERKRRFSPGRQRQVKSEGMPKSGMLRHGQPFDSSDDEDLFAAEHDGDIGINRLESGPDTCKERTDGQRPSQDRSAKWRRGC